MVTWWCAELRSRLTLADHFPNTESALSWSRIQGNQHLFSSLTMINSRAKKSSPDTGNAPITIQVQVINLQRRKSFYKFNVQVPPGGDGSPANSTLLPQQDCPAFSGDAVLNGAFKKISNSVDPNMILILTTFKTFIHFPPDLERKIFRCPVLPTGLDFRLPYRDCGVFWHAWGVPGDQTDTLLLSI